MNSIEGLVQQVQELTELSAAQVRTIETKDAETVILRAQVEDLQARLAQEAATHHKTCEGYIAEREHYRRERDEQTARAEKAEAAPQQHAQAPDLYSVTCWVETEEGGLCQALARASDIKDPDNAFVRLSAVLKLLGGSQQHAQAAQQTGTRKIGVTEDGLAALSGAGHSPLPLTDEQVIGVLHSCGIDTYPSVNGFASLQVSATSIVWVREVVRRCMALVAAPVAAAVQGEASEVSEAQIDAGLKKLSDLDGQFWSRGGTDARYMMRKILNAALNK